MILPESDGAEEDGNMTVKQIEKSVEGLDLDKALEKLYCLKAEFGDRVDKIIEKYEKKNLI